jgi:hypothetical protein
MKPASSRVFVPVHLGLIVAFVSLFVCGQMHATPVKWYVWETFDGGVTLTGYFVYDFGKPTAIQRIPDFNLVVSNGGFPGHTFTPGNTTPNGADPAHVEFDSPGSSNLYPGAEFWDTRLNFATAMTDAGGRIDLLANQYNSMINHGFSGRSDDYINLWSSSGFIISESANVPETSAEWLLWPVLLALIGVRMRLKY